MTLVSRKPVLSVLGLEGSEVSGNGASVDLSLGWDVPSCTNIPIYQFTNGMDLSLGWVGTRIYRYTNVPVYQWLDLSLELGCTLFYRFFDGSIETGIPHFEKPVATQNFAS